MSRRDKPIVWLQGEVKSPPFTKRACLETGFLLRRLQQGDILGLPHVRPMPVIAAYCYELRVRDESRNWRIVYRIEPDAIVILDVFEKKTRATPPQVIQTCRRRLQEYLKSGSKYE